MIDISRKHPWSLNIDSICPSFLDNPAPHRLGAGNYWSIEVEFETLLDDYNIQNDIISLHPSSIGVFIYKNYTFLHLHQNNDGRSIFIDKQVVSNSFFKLQLSHYPNEKLELKFQDEVIHTEPIDKIPLDTTGFRNMYIGSHTHDNIGASEEPALRIYRLKIKDDEGIVGEYDWSKDTYFDGRVMDLSGNNNILYEVE